MQIVLLVDDDASWCAILHRALEPMVPADWDIFETTDPVVAFERLVYEPRIRIAFVDYYLNMGGLDGERVIAKAMQKRPDLRGRIVVCSGASFDEYMEHRLFTELGCLALRKPFELSALEELLRPFVSPTGDVPV